MEPNLISKFLDYYKKKPNNTSSDININDTGIEYNDLRSNDLWCLTYLVLITFNFEFAKCYTFDPTNDTKIVGFKIAEFIKIYKTFCEKFQDDKNLIYVMNSLLG